ncbi:MAG: transporter [Planctomycetes bacterium]|nr:transporter [Planctomycetota bacterium]
MVPYSAVLRYSALFAVFAIAPDCLASENGYRKTLMQWSYGTSFEGGPDLYEPLVTDRPDFTESSVTVGYGVVQLETGYTFTYDSAGDDRTRSHSFPESLLRVGMFAEWFEFRIEWNYFDEETEIGGVEDSVSGAEDLGLGMKIALTPQECLLPETAIILQMTVPSGSSELTADEVLPGFNYLYSWEINDEWSTGGSTAINNAIDDVTFDSYSEFSQSWTVGHSWSDRVGSYVEWFVIAPTSADTNRVENYFNGGFTVLFNNDLQWDIRAGVGLNSAADDFFTGTGLSFRYW